MKSFPLWMASLTFCALSLPAQVTTEEDLLQTEAARRARETPPWLTEPRHNEIKAGKLTYDGVAVEIAVVDNPLELINPFAPPQYGQGEANLVRDPITGHPSGIKVFSVSF